MFDLFASVAESLVAPVRQLATAATTAPEAQVCVDESYATDEAPEYAPIMSMMFGAEDGGEQEWTEDDDPLGQYGREEDEAMVAELASQVDIDMIDDSDKVGRMGVRLADNPVAGFRNLDEMVGQALAAADGSPIGQLSLMDHASPASQGIGDQKLTLESLQDPAVLAQLAMLRDNFGSGGSLELHGCRVGGDEIGDQFLREMARVLDVPVSGGNDYQTSALPGLEGNVKTCYPPAIDENGDLVQTCTVDSDPADYLWAANRALWRSSLPTSEMTPGETRVLE